MCGLTRLLLAGFVIGTAVSSVTGSDLAGWVVGMAVAAAVATVQRAQGGSTCAVKAPARLPADDHRES